MSSSEPEQGDMRSSSRSAASPKTWFSKASSVSDHKWGKYNEVNDEKSLVDEQDRILAK